MCKGCNSKVGDLATQYGKDEQFQRCDKCDYNLCDTYGKRTCNQHCCARLEKALSPTIVSKDKRQYAVYTDFDKMRDKYRRIHLEIDKRSENFLVGKKE